MPDKPRFAAACLVILATASAPLRAQQGEENAELARELGAMLAWRLSPGVVEEKCRHADPDNNAVRVQALKSWQDRNAKTIAAVDDRVHEVMVRLQPAEKVDAAVNQVVSQVRGLIIEEIFAKAGPEQTRAICKAESDPAGSRWNINGTLQVQQSLAALYDWLARQK
jgi:hypothetical protein